MIDNRYKDRYFLNYTSLFTEWGVVIEKGGYEELLKEPKRKESYVHSWKDRNGSDRFINNNFESRNITLNFTFICETLEDYLAKKESLYSVLKASRITLSSTTLGKEWKLLYDSVTSTSEQTTMFRGGEVVSKHVINFIDDNVESGVFVPMVYLTDENGNFLTDENGNYLTTNL